MYGEREVTAQEAALDALGLPLIEFSCDSVCLQVRKPADTVHFVRPREQLEKKRRVQGKLEWGDITYDPPVTKYIRRKLIGSTMYCLINRSSWCCNDW